MIDGIRIGWNSIFDRFYVTSDQGIAELPVVARDLLEDVDLWKTYLLGNFEPQDTVLAGVWRPDDARWWFVDEARRLENEFRRQLAGRSESVQVDPYPGIIPIRVFADYSSFPLWTTEGATGPEDFPMLSEQLKTDLMTWNSAVGAAHPNRTDNENFITRLRAELGPTFNVS